MLKIGTERFYFLFTNFSRKREQTYRSSQQLITIENRNSPVVELSWTMSRYFNYYKLFQYATRRESCPKY